MTPALPAPAPTWTASALRHAREHPWIGAAFAIGLIGVLALAVQSAASLASGAASAGLKLALLGGTAGFAATALGGLPALALRGMPQKAEDTLLGFAAGMMLAASAFSLLLPGLEAGAELTGHRLWGALVVLAGLAIGVMVMLGMDQFTPHEHDKTGPCGAGHERCGRLWLFVFAIALHNLPEGMAVGVAFSRGELAVGLPLATAIAIQDIPEGLAVALALRGAGFSPLRAAVVAGASGLLEPVGALFGVGLSSGTALAYPAGLGLAAGAMLFVVSHEVIPETHRNGHQTPATLGLMGGFALMMLLDTTLG